jgi:two-component sensor histidine kinase
MESLEKLIGKNELLSAIINNAFDAIVCYKTLQDNTGAITDFRFLYLNEPALNFLHGNKEDFIGKSLLSLFPYAAEDGMFDMFRKTVETGQPMEGIFYYDHGGYKGWYRDSAVKYGDGIIVYFREVTSQIQIENELKKLIKEKDILLKETHHRVKNNLQVVSSMLSLRANEFGDEPKLRDKCHTCKQRIKTMANIHQRLYEDDDFQSVDLKLFVKEMLTSAKSLFEGYNKQIYLKFNIDDIKINLNSSVNIGLIINELLTNSVKYAFQNKASGTIEITVKQSNRTVVLIISDDGDGLPKGFRLDKTDTLGLVLVRSLVDQLDGTVKIENSLGTKFIITLPDVVIHNSLQH